ncbi:MAG: CDP-diacylglycerol--glycerol-3-phosphate 3-phosphatidyltransferase [Flavobacteriaceae bacterium]
MTNMNQRAVQMPKHATSLPNILTYGRILAVPAIGISFFLEGDLGRWIAFAIFAAASITDFFDGYLARAWHMQSALGRMLDPIADKLLVATTILILVAEGTLAGWSLIAAIVILCREILVSGLRELLAELQVSVPVSTLAKWKTTAQMLALGFLLTGPAGDKLIGFATDLGLALFWLAAILTLYTGWDYMRAGIRHIIETDA